MSGSNLLFDTNAFIYFFEGRQHVTELVAQTPVIYFSPISEIELLSASFLSSVDMANMKRFLSLCTQVGLSSEIVTRTIQIRRRYRHKIPDAIIAASAMTMEVPLVTADTDFNKISGLVLITDILT